MKTVTVFFINRDTASEADYRPAVKILLAAGFTTDEMRFISTNREEDFRALLAEAKGQDMNMLVFFDGKTRFDIKNVIADETGVAFAKDENAWRFVEAVANTKRVDLDEYSAVIPINSTLIPNVNGCLQGFITERDGMTLALLPENSDEYGVMCEKYVIPYLEKKYSIKRKRLVLKYFGSAELLEKTLEDAARVSEAKFTYDVSVSYGDYTVGLCFENYDDANVGIAIRHIVSTLKDDIYAEYDASLSERLFDLLRLRKMKIASAESFTGGRVISSIINNSGASSVVIEGLVSYSDESKQKLLGVKREDLAKEGAVSSIVAYQMATGLLNSTDCDVAIATTGLAGPNTDPSGKPVGLCYIAIGMKDGVHTYRFNFKGDRETITETAKNTALYLAIKKIKNHNL